MGDLYFLASITGLILSKIVNYRENLSKLGSGIKWTVNFTLIHIYIS